MKLVFTINLKLDVVNEDEVKKLNAIIEEVGEEQFNEQTQKIMRSDIIKALGYRETDKDIEITVENSIEN